jgi:FeS assembly SUF system protein
MSNPLAETPLPSLLRPRVHADLHAQITAAFKSVYDPESPVDIYELGLIYGYDIQDNGHVAIQMTLTAPACPEAGTLPGMVESRVAEIDGVNGASVELVWDPPWTPARMSEGARLSLGMDMDF